MIHLYTGTPGSGKSLHAAKDIIRRLRRPGGLICNFPVNEDYVPSKRRKSHVEYWDNSRMTAQRLVSFALEHHAAGKEGQTLVIIDEAQLIFNSREFGRKDRMEWISLFSQHRHLGYNFILITQHDRMLDRQIRALVESEVRHRKLNNYGFIGFLLSLFQLQLFVALEYWYGGNRLLLGKEFYTFQRKFSKVYDSYKLFSDLATAGGRLCRGGPAEPVGPRGTAATSAVDEQHQRQQLLGRLAVALTAALQQGARCAAADVGTYDGKGVYSWQIKEAETGHL